MYLRGPRNSIGTNSFRMRMNAPFQVPMTYGYFLEGSIDIKHGTASVRSIQESRRKECKA